jgi:hypothetical protein
VTREDVSDVPIQARLLGGENVRDPRRALVDDDSEIPDARDRARAAGGESHVMWSSFSFSHQSTNMKYSRRPLWIPRNPAP